MKAEERTAQEKLVSKQCLLVTYSFFDSSNWHWYAQHSVHSSVRSVRSFARSFVQLEFHIEKSVDRRSEIKANVWMFSFIRMVFFYTYHFYFSKWKLPTRPINNAIHAIKLWNNIEIMHLRLIDFCVDSIWIMVLHMNSMELVFCSCSFFRRSPTQKIWLC